MYKEVPFPTLFSSLTKTHTHITDYNYSFVEQIERFVSVGKKHQNIKSA